jgi:hypothetical protein
MATSRAVRSALFRGTGDIIASSEASADIAAFAADVFLEMTGLEWPGSMPQLGGITKAICRILFKIARNEAAQRLKEPYQPFARSREESSEPLGQRRSGMQS